MQRNTKIALGIIGSIVGAVAIYFAGRYIVRSERRAKKRAERIRKRQQIIANYPPSVVPTYDENRGISIAWSPNVDMSTSSFNGQKYSNMTSFETNKAKYENYGDDPVVVSKEFEKYNTGGYKWQGGGSGMPIDIYFKGNRLFTKPTAKTTYCTGYTFAVFFVVALKRGLLDDFTDKDIQTLQKIWNRGDGTEYPKLCVNAIANKIGTNNPLGKEVSLADAQAGDFCQIWRTSKSGHAVVLFEKIMDGDKITGITYYSSNNSVVNPATGRNGAGVAKEYFSDSTKSKKGMLRANTYFARLND